MTDEIKNQSNSKPSLDDEALNTEGQDPVQKTLKKELGGRQGLEPTRYGDWELNGKCVDF